MFNIKQARYGTLLSYSFYCLNFQQLFPILKSIVTHCQLIVIIHHSSSIIHKGSLQNKFSDKVGILSQRGFFLTQSYLFNTKTTTIQNDDFVGILSQYGKGFPSPNQNKLTKLGRCIAELQTAELLKLLELLEE